MCEYRKNVKNGIFRININDRKKSNSGSLKSEGFGDGLSSQIDQCAKIIHVGN